MSMMLSRRHFLSTVSLAGAAAFIGARQVTVAEAALETTAVRLLKFPAAVCLAPQYVAEALLRAEGFTDIRYVEVGPRPDLAEKVGRGEADFTINLAPNVIQAIDAGGAVTVLSGVQTGCWQLFARNEISSLAELKGKSVGMQTAADDYDPFFVVAATHVGLDPKRDIHWVPTSNRSVRAIDLFAEGKVDAFVAIAPDQIEVRNRHLGHVIFDNAVDRPWSQYFCCLLTGNRDFVRKHPVATKRVLRAIVKAADFCAAEPARAARELVQRGFTNSYDDAAQSLRELGYDKWREYDAEDTIRFYALWLREAGLIKSSPQKIIAEGTDWRFLDELRHELKA